MPKISIIVPIYNSAKVLNRTLKSIINQTYTDFEVILIDDESSDHSYELCREWAKKDDRIRLYRVAHCGVAAVRGIGVEKASGEWIGFVDSDDWVEPNWLEELQKYFDADLIVWGYCRETYCYNCKKPFKSIVGVEDIGSVSIRKTPQKVFELEASTLYSLCNKLFRKDLIIKNQISFEPIDCWEDACFVIDYMKVIDRVQFLSDFFYHYVIIEHEQSLSKPGYVPQKYIQYFTLHQHFQSMCFAFSNCEKALRANDLRLIINATSDLIYNNTIKETRRSKADKLDYINRVRGNAEIIRLLHSVKPKDISLKDCRICFLSLQKGVNQTYYVCRVLSVLREIKRKFTQLIPR